MLLRADLSKTLLSESRLRSVDDETVLMSGRPTAGMDDEWEALMCPRCLHPGGLLYAIVVVREDLIESRI